MDSKSKLVEKTIEFTRRSSTYVASTTTLEEFRLLTQIRAMPSGSVYEAIRLSDQKKVEVRLLANDHQVVRRARLAMLVRSPIVVPIVASNLDVDSPFLVYEPPEVKPLLHYAREIDLNSAILWSAQLAQLVAMSHELGLFLNCIDKRNVSFNNEGRIFVDLLAADFGAVPSTTNQLVYSNFEQQHTEFLEHDLEALLRLVGWLFYGEELWDGTRLIQLVRQSISPNPIDVELEQALARIETKVAGVDVHTLSEAFSLLCQSVLSPAASASDEEYEIGPPNTGQRNTGQRNTLQGDIGEGSAWQATRVFARLPMSGVGMQCGRFLLVRELGKGGMGTVFQAEDVADGQPAAVKVLNPETQRDTAAVARFRREARVLGEIASPYIARLLDVNVWQGLHFLAMEFVAGRNLADILSQHEKLPERLALRLISDVAKGLAEAHSRGIVHRDIKPGNIILQGSDLDTVPQRTSNRSESTGSTSSEEEDWSVKLVDFGLARRTEQAESMLVTRADAFVGTPAYMAPEQSQGGSSVDARADIYALGCTLFEMVCGRPPFESQDLMVLIFQHAYDPHPDPRKIVPELTESAARIIDRCLAKKPEGRFENAEQLAREIERLLRGEQVPVVVHPVLPAHDAARVITLEWNIDLESSPEELWPHVSNTERLNRAAGLPPVRYTTVNDPVRGVQRFAEVRVAGQRIRWQEHPFEWIEGRRMAVLRVFQQGPFEWFLSRLELVPRAARGTHLRHQVQVVPRNWLGRLLAYVEIARKARKSFETTYRHIDASLKNRQRSTAISDVFEDPVVLRRSRRQLLETRIQALMSQGVDPEIADRIREYLSLASPQQVARIRPLALAQKLGLASDEVVEACLQGVRQGLLLLHWDLLCPSCRIAADIQSTLKAIQQHGHCEACNLDFEVDWAKSVEMVFQAHPEIREAELRTYCIGGPQHFPHVVAQVRLQPGERLELDLALSPGEYVVRGPQLTRSTLLLVDTSRGVTRSELVIPHSASTERIEFKAGQQWLNLHNQSPVELLVRIERTAMREDAFTAARASSLAVFRELFPSQVLGEGQLATVAHLTYVHIRFRGLRELIQQKGDASAYSELCSWTKCITRIVREHHGTITSEDSDGGLAVFHELPRAIQAAFALLDQEPPDFLSAKLDVGISSGPSLAVTKSNVIEYFGQNVETAKLLSQEGRGGDLHFVASIARHPLVGPLLAERGAIPQVASNLDLGNEIALRVQLGPFSQ